MDRLGGTREPIARHACSWATRCYGVLDVPVGNPAAFAATGHECPARAEIGHGLPGDDILVTAQHPVVGIAGPGLGVGGGDGSHNANSNSVVGVEFRSALSD